MQAHILIIEDDPLTHEMLAHLLAEAGYRTTLITDPRRVPAYLRESDANLILSGVVLHHHDTFSLAAALRREGIDTPIIFLGMRAAFADRMTRFSNGADDYIAMPIEPNIFLARVAAMLRRSHLAAQSAASTILTVGEARLDMGRLLFTAPGRHAVLLTPTEMRILEHLMRNANMIVLRASLIERLRTADAMVDSNCVDLYVRRLRRKIEANPDTPSFVRTVRDVGYLFHNEREDSSPAACE